MLSKTDLTRVYETLLSIPGMNDPVKIDLKLPRKQVLLLSKVIERGLAQKEGEEGPSILSLAPPETRGELVKVAEDLLAKGGLTEMNEKLKSFG